MQRTKIVCTIGPASQSPEMLARLMQAGMDVARVNMSHGTHEMHAENIANIRAVAQSVGKAVAVLLDLQGPKLRVGEMPPEGVLLIPGETVTLTVNPEPATATRVPVQFKRLPSAVEPGDRIMLDDGLLDLVVLSKTSTDVTCRVVTGGVLTSNKGINLPKASFSIASVSEKDKKDVIFGLNHRVDWIALSFVRRADDIHEVRELVRSQTEFGRLTPIIAKIEKPEAVENIREIVAAADGIMVARGDLGIEVSPEAVPMMQKMIIKLCNELGKPVITATQMLDSMIRNPRPTRAEASDVANAILDGTDAIMLSGETAVGKYPVEAIETMVRIAQETEPKSRFGPPSLTAGQHSISEAVCYAATDTAIMLHASAILAPTISGTTARILSHFRAPNPIIAITPNPAVHRQLALFWGIYPLMSQRAPDTEIVITDAITTALNARLIHEGDTVVITAGTAGQMTGTTDLIKVAVLAKTLAEGIGVGNNRVIGRVRRLEAPLPDDIKLHSDEIIVTHKTDRTFVHILDDAAGLITAEDGLDSHGYLLATEQGRPALIGVADLGTLQDGLWIVLDPRNGVVMERGSSVQDIPR
ncbi:MAG: pyruvate kinase [Anaerolineae bacterium]